jgi:hypothetical protein
MDPLAFTNHAEVEPISLFGAGNAGVIARASRLFRRDDDSRSESYSDILRRAGLPVIEGQGNGAADQAASKPPETGNGSPNRALVKHDPDHDAHEAGGEVLLCPLRDTPKLPWSNRDPACIHTVRHIKLWSRRSQKIIGVSSMRARYEPALPGNCDGS